jgi:hypothetical protein
MDAQVLQGKSLIQLQGADTINKWYIVFDLEDEDTLETKQVTYGPFLTRQEAQDDMPRVVGLYTSLKAIG